MLHRRANALLSRELNLRNRFINPCLGHPSWTPHIIDNTAAYVGLLHAEAEAALEEAVQLTLSHGLNCARHGYVRPTFMNALVFYGGEMQERLGINIVPPRQVLAGDPQQMASLWASSGAERFWTSRIDKNHGTGGKYMEGLLHPMGLSLSPKSFRKTTARGVKLVIQARPQLTTDLQELVTLRGRAMHDSSQRFIDVSAQQPLNPLEISAAGRRAAEALASITGVMSRIW